jgi:hypothetical protein
MRRLPVIYDFLKVSDELIDVRAPQLARLLSAAGKKTTPGDALLLIIRLERYVVRRVNDAAGDLSAEFEAAVFLAADRAETTVSVALEWPLSKAVALIEALADPDVAVLSPVDGGGWVVRGVLERYYRFANERRASRQRTRDNARARAAGWEPGDGKTWVHKATKTTAATLADALACADRGVPQ